MSDWRVLWKQIGAGSELAVTLGIPEGGWLPFLVTGGELAELEDGDHVPLRRRDLLWGILVGYHERSAEFDSDRSRELFPFVVDHLVDALRAPSRDAMLSDAVEGVRSAHGDEAASRAEAGAAALQGASP